MTADSATGGRRELAVLLLADGRFPAGGHVHSVGIESAVADRRVTGLASLEDFVIGRLWSVGLTEAALVAATVVRLGDDGDRSVSPTAGGRAMSPTVGGRAMSPTVGGRAMSPTVGGRATDPEPGPVVTELDREAAARIPVPVLRDASRRQGRQVVRVAARCWPSPLLDLIPTLRPDGVHLPVAFGAVAVAAGIGADAAARLSVHHAVATPTQAALRLLGLDPFAVAALAARLAEPAGAVARAAVAAAAGPLADLPARTGPVPDLAAEEHRGWDVRLFAT
jgi:urease accessory protein